MLCNNCGSTIPDDSVFCQKCGNTIIKNDVGKTNAIGRKNVIIICICLVIIALLVGLNIFQFIVNKDKLTEFETLKETNTSLEDENDELNSTIASLQAELEKCEADASSYDDLINTIKYSTLGYASNNFHTDESIILVNKNDKNYTFNLTAYWSDGGNVSIDYDSFGPAAYVDFAQNSWNESTKMIVEPMHSGMTVVTFSNDVNWQTFDVIIIVE